MWIVLLKILGQYAWTYLVPLLFALLEKKFGPGLMAFILELIGERDKEILEGKISTSEAEAINLNIIKQSTRSSPGFSTTMAKFTHTIAYMYYVLKNNEIRFEWWQDGLVLYEQTGKQKTASDFMSLYTSHPDWIKK